MAGRPKGEPTKVVRVYEREAEMLAQLAEREGGSVADVVRTLINAGAKVGEARRQSLLEDADAAGGERCSCVKPDPTPYGVCRACRRRR